MRLWHLCRCRFTLFVAEVASKVFVMAVVEAGCGALNTQMFFPPSGATSTWWGGLVPQEMGEAKSTDQKRSRPCSEPRWRPTCLTAAGSLTPLCSGPRPATPRAMITLWGSHGLPEPLSRAQFGLAGAPATEFALPGGARDVLAKDSGFRVSTFDTQRLTRSARWTIPLDGVQAAPA